MPYLIAALTLLRRNLLSISQEAVLFELRSKRCHIYIFWQINGTLPLSAAQPNLCAALTGGSSIWHPAE